MLFSTVTHNPQPLHLDIEAAKASEFGRILVNGSSFSLVAQYWTARRHAASWLLWIAAGSLYVGMFVFKGLLLIGGLYAVMIMLAIMGYARWTGRLKLAAGGT